MVHCQRDLRLAHWGVRSQVDPPLRSRRGRSHKQVTPFGDVPRWGSTRVIGEHQRRDVGRSAGGYAAILVSSAAAEASRPGSGSKQCRQRDACRGERVM